MNPAGFQITEDVLSPEVCETLIHELSSGPCVQSRAGMRHLLRHPAVASFSRREELLAIARDWLGAAPVPYRATLFEKSGDRNWLVVPHQDTTLPLSTRNASPEWGPWSVKEGVTYAYAPTWALSRIIALRVHLDASTPENGPLRVVPGSHHAGVLSDEEVFRMAREHPPVECIVGRGGVLAMRPLLIHASSKARGPGPRRVLHLEYSASLDLAPGLSLALA
jgi:hypothetical protein